MKTKSCITSAKKQDKKNNRKKISVILIYHSYIYRMKFLGPTPLIEINNTKIIDLHIQTIQNIFKDCEIVIAVGYGIQKISNYIYNKYKNNNIRIVENVNYDTSNICETLRIAINNINNNNFLIVNGNIIFNYDIFNNFTFNKSETIVLQKYHKSNIDVGLNIDENNTVSHFAFGANYAWPEIIYIHSKDSDNIRQLLSNNNHYKNVFIFELLNDIIKHKSIYIQEIIKNNNIRNIDSILNKIT